MLLRPRTRCVVTPTSGTDVLGKEIKGKAYDALCGVVKIETRHEPTTVRADSSASRGYAEEVTVDARLLFPPKYPVQKGDRVDVLDEKRRVVASVRVIEVMPRLNLAGRLDHNQIDGVMWA